MRIKGPTDGSAPPEAPEAADSTGAVERVAPNDAAAVDAVEGPAAPDASDASDPIGQVAARLRAGLISADDAMELLIDDAIHRQVGRAVENEKMETELRQLLRNFAANDPYLAAKIRRLTQPK